MHACLAGMLTFGLVSCATAPKPIVVSVEEQLAILHTATTITVAEFVLRHPDTRPGILSITKTLSQGIDVYATGNVDDVIQQVRVHIQKLEIDVQDKIAMDGLLTVLVPRIRQFMADHPQAMQAVVLEKQVLSWVHDAADLAGK